MSDLDWRTPPRDGWRADAACLGEDTDLWHPHESSDAEDAIAICQACPVRRDCLAEIMRIEARRGTGSREGIYAGLRPPDRARLAGTTRRRDPEPRPPIDQKRIGSCRVCEHPMRPWGVHAAQAPGTRSTGAYGMCSGCYGRHRREAPRSGVGA